MTKDLKHFFATLLAVAVTFCANASTTLPIKGQWVKPSDTRLQYVGRMVTTNPDSYRFSYPGTTVMAAFEGTQIKMMAKPGSGYFMVIVDQAEPFKVAFRGERDSVVTLATALAPGRHTVTVMYTIEGYQFKPEFRGFILSNEGRLLSLPPLPDRRIEFIGNSITCGYGNESTNPADHFEFETENHYFGYAQLTARNLGAIAQIVARSGIGAYRNYGEAKTGSPKYNMPAQYEYTLYNDQSERWDFSRYVPQVVCINLGTNDLSTNNYDVNLLKQGYQKLLGQVRTNNPKAKIVFLCGSMLQGKELEIARKIMDEVTEEAHRAGDAEVYRFDFTPQTGELKYGADWHPSIWQHEKMAGELTAYLRKLMQWF
jgi:lysophospholipase L1-like esterase